MDNHKDGLIKMPQPFDYSVRQSTSPFLQNVQALNMGRNQALQQQAMRKEAEQQALLAARKKAYEQQMIKLGAQEERPGEAYTDLLMQYPEFSKSTTQVWDAMSDQEKQGEIKNLIPLVSYLRNDDQENTLNQLDTYIAAAQNSGDPQGAQDWGNLKKLVEGNYVSARSVLENQLAYAMGPDNFNKMISRGSGAPKEEVTQASRILDDGTTIFATNKGNISVKDASNNTLTGDAAKKAIMRGIKQGISISELKSEAREKGKLQTQEGLKAKIEGEVAGAKTKAAAEEKKVADLIDRGTLAAESTANLRRGIELLDTVKTGGLRAAALRVKQLFGVESADEGELTTNIGKGVLTQLRSTFGAAFTENEGKRLERIEANLTKSPETNKRLLSQALKIAERTAKRAIKAAEKRGDMETVADIQELLTYSLSPGAENKPISQEGTQPPPGAQGKTLIKTQPLTVNPGEQTATHPQTNQKVVYRNGRWFDINTGQPI